jgi:prepilin-type N-terminal cleavage/methylation domain-containing protein/prepilin-type processing-associated H-X9-DG protein
MRILRAETQMKRVAARDAPGFTLIELLTVVGIIALLAGLLVPAILLGREKSRTARCLSNHRQMAIAWTVYAGDHDDRLVPNPDSTLEEGQGYGWVVGHLRMGPLAAGTEVMGDPRVSLLAPYIKNVKVYKCPGDESEFVRSVAMNCRMNPTRYDGDPAWVGGLGTNYVNFRRLSDIQRSSEMLVIMDERSDSINDSYFAIDMSNTGTPSGQGTPRPYMIIDFPGDYHGGGMAASFADGHVRVHRWKDHVRRTPLGQAQARVSAGPSDQDVKWLQDHSTYPR